MKKEVSDKVIIILLILAIVFSIGGSLIVYESVQDFKENINKIEPKPATSVGLVSLTVLDDTNNGGVENEEVIK